MSDFSIPGTGSSKYGTDKLIEGLMKVARVPRDRAAKDLKAFENQKKVWLELNQKLSSLREDARNLYSFKNPFSARIAKSANEDVLMATATREAVERTSSVLVKRVAAADRYLSADLAKDYKVPSGSYGFSVGDKSFELSFSGGSLQDFADSLTRKGKDLLRASVVSVTPDTKALVIESLKTGGKSHLAFKGDAEKLALAAGILEKVGTRAKALDPTAPAAWEKALDRSLVAVNAGILSVATGGETKLPLPGPAKTQGLVLELQYRLVPLAQAAQPSPPPGPSLKPVGQASYGGITVQGAPSEPGLPEWALPPAPPLVEDRNMAYIVGSDGTYRALPALTDGGETQTLRVDLGPILPDMAALALRSKDTTRRLELVSARVFDPAETGGFKPKRPISTAQDALVAVDGIEVTRPTNDISDVVPGVTLQLKSALDKAVNLKVEPDRKAVKDSLISMVGNYNRIMAQLNILTRDDSRIVEEITYFTDEEKKTANERLGLLLNDSTLTMIRNNLQNTMMNPYATGGDVTLLAQLGIATNAQKAGSSQGYDATKMRGYLEIEEETLDKTLASSFETVRRLFGNDSDGDLIVDSGVAFRLEGLLKPYVETAGLISVKTGTLDRQISQQKRSIEDLDRQLATKEADLKRQYASMEASLGQMEGTSSSIDQFSKQNSGQ